MAPVTNLAQLRLKKIAFQGIETLGPLPSPGPRLARAFSFPAGLRPTRAILTAAALGVFAAFDWTSPFSSVPLSGVLPGGELLKGGASTRIGRGSFQTSDGRFS